MEAMDRKLFIIIITIILVMLVMMMALIYNKFLRKKAHFIIQQKKEQAKYQKELSESQIEIKEQTLTYVGQELHDDLGQKLSVAKMMNNMLSTKLQGDLREDVLEINNIIGECIQDIRNLSKTFISGQIEFNGLLESIELEAARIKKLKVPAISLEIKGDKPEFRKEHSLILFRIVQESLNNVLKHSKARNLEMKISSQKDSITIKISDNGVGFQYDEVKRNGLQNMANRADIIGANFLIHAVPGEGTVIKLVYRNKN